MKQIEITKLSKRYDVRKLNTDDVEMIFHFCKSNTQYYTYCGKEPSIELIKSDLEITPPGIPMEQKYYIGFFEGDTLIAVMDFIDGYPSNDCVFIGFFMMNHELQGKGIGSQIISETLEYLRRQGFQKCQLGIDKENPQSNHFWRKNGFEVIREVVQEEGIILVAEKPLKMKILYGTTNKGKLQAMETAVKELDIELIGLNDLESKLPFIIENGKTPLENAEIKARAYYEAFHMPVFSCDSGLYFDELKEEEQPGIHVRRVGGKELTDDEMIEHYSSLAKQHGGKITGRYRNAIYFILDENHHYSSMDMSIATEPFILVTEPHEKRVEGFPLDSLSIDIATGKYYYDLEVKDVSTSVDDGVRAFFSEIF